MGLCGQLFQGHLRAVQCVALGIESGVGQARAAPVVGTGVACALCTTVSAAIIATLCTTALKTTLTASIAASLTAATGAAWRTWAASTGARSTWAASARATTAFKLATFFVAKAACCSGLRALATGPVVASAHGDNGFGYFDWRSGHNRLRCRLRALCGGITLIGWRVWRSR